jgi:hypothetical protein
MRMARRFEHRYGFFRFSHCTTNFATGRDGWVEQREKDAVQKPEAGGWDQERRVSDLAVRTRTFVESGKVWIAVVAPKTPDSRQLRISRTMTTASFGFSNPLRKLNIRMPVDRKLICAAKPVEGHELPLKSSSRAAGTSPARWTS